MIPTMKGFRYRSTGIIVRYLKSARTRDGKTAPGWLAYLTFTDGGFVDDDIDQREISTEGELSTRYFIPDGDQVSGLSLAIDTLIRDVGRLGIEFRTDVAGPDLYYERDGQDPDWPPPPGWRVLLQAEAARIGWTFS